MTYRHIHLIPLAEGLFYTIPIFFLYIVAVYRGDVYPIFPYVSDIGASQPAACFFSQVMNTGSFLMSVCILLRHLEVKFVCDKYKLSQDICKWNALSFKAGLFGASGVSTLGNFGIKQMPVIHLLGAGNAFSGGIIYMSIQAWISVKFYPSVGTRRAVVMRIIFASICCISCIICVLFAILSFYYYQGNFLEFDFTKWSPQDGGYGCHLVSVFSEWVLIFSTIYYLVTYVDDFKDMVLFEPKLELVSQKEEKSKAKENSHK